MNGGLWIDKQQMSDYLTAQMDPHFCEANPTLQVYPNFGLPLPPSHLAATFSSTAACHLSNHTPQWASPHHHSLPLTPTCIP